MGTMLHDITELMTLLQASGPAYLALVVFMLLYMRSERKVEHLQAKLVRLATSQATAASRISMAMDDMQRPPPPAAVSRRTQGT